MKKALFSLLLISSAVATQAQTWIDIPQEAKPYTRWWWLGSAVDEKGLDYTLSEYAKAGIGGVEITPIYGVNGNEKNELKYLSPEWMKMLRYTEEKGGKLGVETNMATGTGWPFGGPKVPLSQAACKAIFQEYFAANFGKAKVLDISCTDKKQKQAPTLSRVMLCSPDHETDDITNLARKTKDGKGYELPLKGLRIAAHDKIIVLYVGRTQQMVKRAAPGGEGFVIDHFDKEAVRSYLATFETAFNSTRTARPHTFFNDSYEVYGADWTPSLLEEFNKRRGYALEDVFDLFLMPDSLRTDQAKRVLSDYRETMGELLLENFTTQWTEWAHKGGSITRNQAHGSPANLIDLYAEVDIPECEGFGLSDFKIKGLRTDPGFTKPNYSDISMLKYASSGAHIAGKKYTSSETFTWLTEHFRTSFSQCKPDIDLMFVAGVNHVFFHGSCYSPQDDAWPGWRFYASVDMTPNNPQWVDMSAFSQYIQRCQSFLQWGQPDNDFLVYLPFYDMIYEQPNRIALFDIHSMAKRAPKFIQTIQSIIQHGYDVDYISDRYLLRAEPSQTGVKMKNAGNYSAIIIPDVKFMPLETVQQLLKLAKSGVKVIFVANYPSSMPGFGRVYGMDVQEENTAFNNALKELKGKAILAKTYDEALQAAGGRREAMRNDEGLSCIRRCNNEGYHYFISNLQGKDVDNFVNLGVNFEDAVLYNPMTGEIGKAQTQGNKVRIQLASGESVILRTFNQDSPESFADYLYYNKEQFVERGQSHATPLNNWTLSFPQAAPKAITETFSLTRPASWTTLNNEALNSTMATGLYATSFKLKDITKANKQLLKAYGKDVRYILDLGDVRESARVVLNGQEVATLFAVPFRCDITKFLKKGTNTLQVYVTNLPANRIAKMDRDGVVWRKFKEINVVDLNYKKNLYNTWTPVPSGLNSDVKLIAMPAE